MKNLKEYILEYNIPVDKYTGKNCILYLKNMSQLFLYEYQLTGQISDGLWENSKPREHWRFWANVEVKIGNQLELISPKENWNLPLKNNYNFKSLIKYVGDELIATGKIGKSKYAEKILASKIDKFSLVNIIMDGSYNYKKIDSEGVKNVLSVLSETEIDEIQNIKYTKSELNKDLEDISTAMRNIVRRD